MTSSLPLRWPSGRTLTLRAAQIIGAAVLFRDYIAEAAICAGESMLPTLRNEGDILLVEKLSPVFKNIKRGDVIVCVSPTDPDKLICKRVIGLDHDTVATQYGGIFTSQREIPKGHIWVEGDNSAKSLDSRDFGPIPYGLIRGKVMCKLWPISEFGQALVRK